MVTCYYFPACATVATWIVCSWYLICNGIQAIQWNSKQIYFQNEKWYQWKNVVHLLKDSHMNHMQGYRILQQKVNHFHFFLSFVFILFDEQRVFQITIEQIFSNKSQKNNREMVEIQTEWITMRLAWCKYLEWHSACYEKRINRRRGVWGAWNQYTFILLLPRMFLYSNAIHTHTHTWMTLAKESFATRCMCMITIYKLNIPMHSKYKQNGSNVLLIRFESNMMKHRNIKCII